MNTASRWAYNWGGWGGGGEGKKLISGTYKVLILLQNLLLINNSNLKDSQSIIKALAFNKYFSNIGSKS